MISVSADNTVSAYSDNTSRDGITDIMLHKVLTSMGMQPFGVIYVFIS